MIKREWMDIREYKALNWLVILCNARQNPDHHVVSPYLWLSGQAYNGVYTPIWRRVQT